MVALLTFFSCSDTLNAKPRGIVKLGKALAGFVAQVADGVYRALVCRRARDACLFSLDASAGVIVKVRVAEAGIGVFVAICVDRALMS